MNLIPYSYPSDNSPPTPPPHDDQEQFEYYDSGVTAVATASLEQKSLEYSMQEGPLYSSGSPSTRFSSSPSSTRLRHSNSLTTGSVFGHWQPGEMRTSYQNPPESRPTCIPRPSGAHETHIPESLPYSTSDGSYSIQSSPTVSIYRPPSALPTRLKNGIEYGNAFDGREAVERLLAITGISDRGMALRLGRALGAQRLFHDVTYELPLMDSSSEIYQFNTRIVSHPRHESESAESMNTGNSVSRSSSSRVSIVAKARNDEDAVDRRSLLRGNGGTTGSMLDEFPSGVFTPFTRCYSPTCSISRQPCYSPLCPRMMVQEEWKNRTSVENTDSLSVQAPQSSGTCMQELSIRLWVDVVPQEVRESISDAEWKRQEAIFELILTEENFVKDLEYINEMWITPLRENNLISDPQRRDAFIRAVFANIMEIYEVNSQLVAAFHARQREHPIVPQIGDIMLSFVGSFTPFIEYGASQYEARFALEHERLVNKEFREFVNITEQHPSSRRLPLSGHLSHPTTRLGRYNLLLEQILKRTPVNHPDREAIPQVIQQITDLMTRMNARAGLASTNFDLLRIHSRLRFKMESDRVDLRLLEEGRRILRKDTLRKTPSLESTEFKVILFDHYLVVFRIRTVNGIQEYIVQRPPIPIDFLVITTTEPGRLPRSASILPYYIPSGLAASLGPHMPLRTSTDSGYAGVAPNANVTAAGIIGPSRPAYPIVFTHLGRKGSGSFTLYSPSEPARKPWFDVMHEVQTLKDRRTAVFQLTPAVRERQFFVDTKINHMITFNDGRQYLLATDKGLYVGHTARSSIPHKVLDIPRVHQVAALEGAQKLLILADKTLWDYALGVVNGSPNETPSRNKIMTNVSFFHVGRCLGRVLVCVAQCPSLMGLRTSVTIFEAKSLDDYNRGHNEPDRLRLPSPLDLRLKRLKEHAFPSEVWDIELTNTKMLVTTARGMAIQDMQSMGAKEVRPLLNHADTKLSFITDRERGETLHLKSAQKNIAMFRTPHGEYLVCYDEYAFYIDGEGNRWRPDFLIEWEGSPEAFAFVYPYVVAFEPSFMEVRSVLTGGRLQIIKGTGIRCLSHHSVYRYQAPIIFGVMTDPENDCYQRIFRLDRFANDDNSPSPAPTA